MNIDVNGFKDLIRKATLNFLIENVQFNITQDMIKTKMISQSNDSISIINIKNDIINGIKKDESYQFNFMEPNQSLIPFLNLIEDDEAEINIKPEKIILKVDKQKSNIFFCAPQVVSVFTMESMREDIKYFKELSIDDEFIDVFNKIKKVANKFGKIYFTIENNKLLMETTDKTNNFSNDLRFELDDVEFSDITMCFDFKNVMSVMAIIDDEFKIDIAYVSEQEMGLLYFHNNDKSEQYYLMSRRD